MIVFFVCENFVDFMDRVKVWCVDFDLIVWFDNFCVGMCVEMCDGIFDV